MQMSEFDTNNLDNSSTDDIHTNLRSKFLASLSYNSPPLHTDMSRSMSAPPAEFFTSIQNVF